MTPSKNSSTYWPKRRYLLQRLAIFLLSRSSSTTGASSRRFDVRSLLRRLVEQQLRRPSAHSARRGFLLSSLAKDVFHPLERRRYSGKVFGAANSSQSLGAGDGVGNVVVPGSNRRVHHVVCEPARPHGDRNRGAREEMLHFMANRCQRLRPCADAWIRQPCKYCQGQSAIRTPRRIFTIPLAARRNAKGSFDPVGFNPIANISTD